MSLRIRRGTETQRNAALFDLGEIVYTTDTKQVFIGDGVTPGGKNVVENCGGIGLQWNQTTQQLDIDGTGLTTENILESGDNLYFKTDRSQDAAAALFTPNTGHTGISFLYDDITGKIYATVTSAGTPFSLINDTNPHLGGNLVLNAYNITGIGNIDITGAISAQNISAALGEITTLNAHNITALTVVTGAISATTISASLGGNLGLNTYDITGTGDINITGAISATTISASLGGNLVLNAYDITGVGNIDITGAISATTISASLGGDLVLNGHSIAGVGDIDITGNLNIDGTITSMATNMVLTSLSDGTPGSTPGITVGSSRGTISDPTPSLPDDYVGKISFRGYNNGFAPVASIIGIVDLDTGVIPLAGKLALAVVSQPGVNNIVPGYTAATFNSYGVFAAPAFQLYGSTAAQMEHVLADTSNVTNFEGTLVWDSTSNSLAIYNGLGWATVNTTVGAPITAKGVAGDTIGMTSGDGVHMYYCYASYTNGINDIWGRTANVGWI